VGCGLGLRGVVVVVVWGCWWCYGCVYALEKGAGWVVGVGGVGGWWGMQELPLQSKVLDSAAEACCRNRQACHPPTKKQPDQSRAACSRTHRVCSALTKGCSRKVGQPAGSWPSSCHCSKRDARLNAATLQGGAAGRGSGQ